MKAKWAAFLTAAALLLTGCSVQIPGFPQEESEPEIAVYNQLPLPALFADIPQTFTETSSEQIDKFYVCDDASIIFMEDPNPCNDLYAYAISALVEYQKLATSEETIDDAVIQGNSHTVQTLEFIYSLGEEGDGPTLHAIVGFISDGASVFTVTCKSEVDTFESHREEFLTTLRSVRIDRTGT